MSKDNTHDQEQKQFENQSHSRLARVVAVGARVALNSQAALFAGYGVKALEQGNPDVALVCGVTGLVVEVGNVGIQKFRRLEREGG